MAHTNVTTKITYTKEIARLIERRCLRCHAAGADVPLARYDDVRAWAVAIREQVQSRSMPPWDAVRGFGQFRNDESLTQPEIDLFVQWVEGGTPKGEDLYLPSNVAATAPAVPKFGGGFFVRWERRVRTQTRLAALRIPEAPEGSDIQVTLATVTGEVRPLLWVRSFRKKSNRTYVLAEPIDLPTGSSIRVHGPPGTLVSGWLAREPQTAR